MKLYGLSMLFQAGAPGTALPGWLDPSCKSRLRALLASEAEFCLENTGKLLKRSFLRSPFQKEFSFGLFRIKMKINVLCCRKSPVNTGVKTQAGGSSESPFHRLFVVRLLSGFWRNYELRDAGALLLRS